MVAGYSLIEWLALVEHELLLFASIFFLIGMADELAVDLAWLWLKITGRAKTPIVERAEVERAMLRGPAAVLIPAWQEEEVIAGTIRHLLDAWPHRQLRVYVGCYRNDLATAEAIMQGIAGDPRGRMIVHDRIGPSTKADCLNRLYRAMEEDEARYGEPVRLVLLHDAEDVVDPAALVLVDRTIGDAEFVQLPVMPLVQRRSRWIGGHYCEEFAEAHGKAMVVRNHLAVGLPAAGVGCAFARPLLADMAKAFDNGSDPFSSECLTEDYELGLRVRLLGRRSRFLRVRGDDGRLVATRACFPAQLVPAVRQKTRWIYGIAFQGWDRLGWAGRAAELWMRLRDRRGPFNALVLAVGYALMVLATVLWALELAGYSRPWIVEPWLWALLALNFASFAWRAAMRFAFTSREYGIGEGMRAVLRIPLSNIISIMAGRRAIFSYIRTMFGHLPTWDKTSHGAHQPPAPAHGAAEVRVG